MHVCGPGDLASAASIPAACSPGARWDALDRGARRPSALIEERACPPTALSDDPGSRSIDAPTPEDLHRF